MLQMVQAGGMLNMVASVSDCVSFRLTRVVGACRRKGGQIDSRVRSDVWLIVDKAINGRFRLHCRGLGALAGTHVTMATEQPTGLQPKVRHVLDSILTYTVTST